MQDLAAKRQTLDEVLPLTMYTKALSRPREVRVLPRGNWLDASGEVVEPAIPSFLGSVDAERRASRMDLAKWLVTPSREGGAGEMTARVLVNRIWALLFGQGLCPSLEDFGGQGQPPNHLELLDHLAIGFVESGWDIKALIRRLVLTQTYRQSSIPDDLVLTQDPDNLLFARQTRYRLPAETVRDNALAISGLLNKDVGGPSVKPPQPPGYYQHLNFPKSKYHANTDESQWRRGLYMHWQRQFLHPMLRAFDAPLREECTAQRTVSNTPLAALTMMNDPVFIEASRSFAQRILTEPVEDNRARIEFAFREATGREPKNEETDVLIEFLEDNLAYYHTLEGDAELLAGQAGQAKVGITQPIFAAWTQVARAILNLHEVMTRE